MTMKNPPHPGLSVRHDCIEPLGLTITEAAEVLGVTRQTLNNLVNGESGISADMAIRLDKAFGGGAETWLRLQMAYDLAQARQHEADIQLLERSARGVDRRRDRHRVVDHDAAAREPRDRPLQHRCRALRSDVR